MPMEYPDMKDVDRADHLQICKWWRGLPTPKDSAQRAVLNFVVTKFSQGGGLTSEIIDQLQKEGRE